MSVLDERYRLLEQYATDDYKGAPCCTFAPDDSLILFGKLETALSVADGKEVPFFCKNRETFVSCGFSSNGKRLVTSNDSNAIKLWDIAKQSLLSSLYTEIPVNSCTFSNTGLFIIANRNYESIYNDNNNDAEDSFCVWNTVTWQRCDERNKKGEAIAGGLCKRCFPATFEFAEFKRLNIKPCQPLPYWNRPSNILFTGIFNGVECHFALDLDSFSAVENTHFTTLACWNIAFTTCDWNLCCALNTIDDNLWLYADMTKIIVFETLVSALKKSSCLHSPAVVYSSSFSPDSSRLATCTSDGCVNLWNVDSNEVEQRFKCNREESPFACWWSENFLFIFHVSDGIPTLSQYLMNTNLELLLFQQNTSVAVSNGNCTFIDSR